jgi:DNA-binding NarL/FixJ family response regulator
VLIVDDQAPFRSVARTVVALSPGFEVIAEAGAGDEAVALADSTSPRVVLMDINLPGMNGIDATREIVTRHPDTVVILLSSYKADALPADALTCGAARYLHKEDFGPAVLAEIWQEHAPA